MILSSPAFSPYDFDAACRRRELRVGRSFDVKELDIATIDVVFFLPIWDLLSGRRFAGPRRELGLTGSGSLL